MQAKLIRSSEATEYYFEERCYITEYLNEDADPGLSIANARVPPGVTTVLHRVTNTAERYLILEGKGLAEVQGMPPQVAEKGDVVLIPPGASQRIANTGDTDLVFLAMCTPRFRPENYEDLETADE